MNYLTVDSRIKPLLPANFSSYSMTARQRVGQKNLWLESYQYDSNNPMVANPATVTVARSYNTVIAVLQAGRWVVTSAKYSKGTSRHCGLLCQEWSTRV